MSAQLKLSPAIVKESSVDFEHDDDTNSPAVPTHLIRLAERTVCRIKYGLPAGTLAKNGALSPVSFGYGTGFLCCLNLSQLTNSGGPSDPKEPSNALRLPAAPANLSSEHSLIPNVSFMISFVEANGDGDTLPFRIVSGVDTGDFYVTDSVLDFTFIELSDKCRSLLEANQRRFQQLHSAVDAYLGLSFKVGEAVFIPQFPKEGSIGRLKVHSGYVEGVYGQQRGVVKHSVFTKNGASGSPVYVVNHYEELRLVGVHFAGIRDERHNLAVSIDEVIFFIRRNLFQKEQIGLQQSVSKFQFDQILSIVSEMVEKKVDDLLERYDLDCDDIEPLTVFHFAAFHGDIDFFKQLIDAVPMTQTRQIPMRSARLGRTPFIVASSRGLWNVMQFCLQYLNSNVSEVDFEGNGAFHWAAKQGHVAILTKLLTMDDGKYKLCLLDATNKKGKSALHLAVSSKQIEAVRFLLDNGANSRIRSSNGQTPFHESAYANSVECTEELISRGLVILDDSEEGQQNCRALHLAAFYGNKEVVQFLLTILNHDWLNRKDAGNCTVLARALTSTSIELAKWLLESFPTIADSLEAKCTEIDFTLLHIAAGGENKLDFVKLLLQYNAKLSSKDKFGNTPIHIAANADNAEALALLLDQAAFRGQSQLISSGNNRGWTPLHYAALKGGHDTASALLGYKEGRDCIEKRTSDEDKTALQIAAFIGNTSVVLLLLKHGANVMARDGIGCSAFQAAAQQNHADIVRIFFQDEAIGLALLNTEDNQKTKPIFYTALWGSLESMGELLRFARSHNCLTEQLESRGQLGFTPLLAAIHQGQFEMFNFLMKAGADVFTRGEDGIGAGILAAQEGQYDILKELLKDDQIAKKILLEEDDEKLNPLYHSIVKDHYFVVRLLCQTADRLDCKEELFKVRNEHGLGPLLAAAGCGSWDIVQYLVDDQSIDIMNAKNNFGHSVIHMSALNGNHELMLKMLRKWPQLGNKLTELDSLGTTPIWMAAANGHENAVEALYKYAVKIGRSNAAEGANRNGVTPLHVAAKKGHARVVQFLLNSVSGALTAADDKHRATSLHYAAKHGRKKVITMMISIGGKDVLKLRDKCGATAILWAVKGGHVGCVKLLLTLCPGAADLMVDYNGQDIHWYSQQCKKPLLRLMMSTFLQAVFTAGNDRHLAQSLLNEEEEEDTSSDDDK